MIKSFIVTRVNLSLPPPPPYLSLYMNTLPAIYGDSFSRKEILNSWRRRRKSGSKKMSFMERRGGLTRFKTGFGIVIRVPSPMILSIDRWIDRSSYRVESSCNKLGKRGEINSRLDRINGIFARDCKVQFIRLSLSLSLVRVYRNRISSTQNRGRETGFPGVRFAQLSRVVINGFKDYRPFISVPPS